MNDHALFERTLHKALAFAHAALEEPSDEHLANARAYAEVVLPRFENMKRYEFTLRETREIVLLVLQLRAVLEAAERRASTGERTTYRRAC